MTQYSIPQDGSDRDGGPYSTTEAIKELLVPYYTKDRPLTNGLYVREAEICGNAVIGFLVEGSVFVNGKTYITDSNELMNLAYGDGYYYALVLIDNTDSVWSVSTADVEASVLLLSNDGFTSSVAAGDMGHRYIRVDGNSVPNLIYTPECFILQYLVQSRDVPSIGVSNTNHLTSNIKTFEMVNTVPVHPNEIRLNGVLGINNLVGGNTIDSSLYLEFGGMSNSHVNFFSIDGVAISTIVPTDIPATANHLVRIALGEFTVDVGQATHLTYNILLQSFQNMLLVSGTVIKHKLPIGNTGVHNPAFVVGATVHKLSGFIKTKSADWTFVKCFVYGDIENNQFPDYFGTNCKLEATYR